MNIVTITKEVENKVQITLDGNTAPTKFFSIESLAEEIVRLNDTIRNMKEENFRLLQVIERTKQDKSSEDE